MGKGQVSNHSKGAKLGLSTSEVMVSSRRSAWMESEHEIEHRISKLSYGRGPGRKCLATAPTKEGVRFGQDWCANATGSTIVDPWCS